MRSKWSDIDWDFRTLFIGLTKNGEPVLAPLSDAAIARLQQIPRLSNNEYIICGKKPDAHLVGLPHIWLRVRAAANLPDVRLHDPRRTVGSWLVQRSESLHLVDQILNHRDTKTTAGYAYFQTQHRARALTAHGHALMKFASVSSSTVMALAYEAPVTRHLPTSGGEDPARRAHYVSREDLYRLVWEAPVSEVARRFGISDVGLAMAC